jgi:hypothetical protein
MSENFWTNIDAFHTRVRLNYSLSNILNICKPVHENIVKLLFRYDLFLKVEQVINFTTKMKVTDSAILQINKNTLLIDK